MKALRILSLVSLVLLTASLYAQTYTVETVPNPKKINGTLVSNPDGILSPASVTSINAMLLELEKKNGTQATVVAVNSVGEDDIFDFAQRLFVKWGIGEKSKDNGLLILLVLDKRTVRFHTGFGLETFLPDATCKHIQTTYMIPHFKNGDYSRGMEEGVKATVSYLTDATFASSMESEDTIAGLMVLSGFYFVITLIVGLIRLASRTNRTPRFPDNSRSMKAWWLWFLLFPTIVAIVSVMSESYGVYFSSMYGVFTLSVLDKLRTLQIILKTGEQKNEYNELHTYLRRSSTYWGFMAFIFPLPGIFGYWWVRAKQNYFRNHPRDCNECGSPVHRLSEKTEDAFLSIAQQFEEQLKSVDYDVWKCTQCDNFSIEIFENQKSKYDPCPKCKTKACFHSGTKTTMRATYSSTGLSEETYLCKYCGHSHIQKVVLPMLVESSSSSSGSDSSWSSSSSSSSDFGGGDSGGGGASSSW